jgi:hypothetical protein
MGAWGEESFQNDAAMDWLPSLEGEGVAVLRRTLSAVADTREDDYLDVDDGSATLAAAEIVAASRRGERDRVPKGLGAWLDSNAAAVTAEDEAVARRAVQRVLARNSELSSLWGHDAGWHANVRALLGRLGG